MNTTEKETILDLLEQTRNDLSRLNGLKMTEAVEKVSWANKKLTKAIKLLTLAPTYDSVDDLEDYDYDPYTY